jgi:hypothetical protein
MGFDVYNLILIPILISIVGVVIWEIIKFFIPPKFYLPFVKYKRKFHLRDTNYPTIMVKSYKLFQETDDLTRILREKVDLIFNEYKLDYLESDEDKIVFQIIKESLVCKFIIHLNLEEDSSLMVKISSNIQFKELKDGLNIMFWALADFYEGLNEVISPESTDVKVKIDIKEMNLMAEILEESDSTVIISKNISLQKDNDHTKLILSGRRGPELANKIRNIIVLGSL